MPNELLTTEQVERLSARPLSYPEVGRTRGELPQGYHHLARQATLGSGETTFRRAADDLSHWLLQRRAGVRVRPSTETVTEGAQAILLLGVGPLALRAPVRVVYVLDEPRARGFAYGTLPGHPESGEEAFVVEHQPDGTVVCRITAFSRPVSRLARLGGPVATRTQSWVTSRYLRSLRD